MFDFSDKVVVVTGSTSGIGRAIAEAFYKSGAKIAICSRKQADVDKTLLEIGKGNCENVLGMAVDVSDKRLLNSFLEEVVLKFGRIDIMINNAGVQFPKPSLQVCEEDWNATVNTNMKAYFFASQFAAADMINRKAPGVIINIGSVNAVTVVPGQVVYASTKAGIAQMTKSLAREWSRNGIRVNCVAPGSIPTAINAAIYTDPKVEKAMCEKIPMGRRGKTSEIADATLYLASEFASYITGQTLYVDGGLTLVHG